MVVALLVMLNWREAFVAWTVLLVLVVPLLSRLLLRGHDQRHKAYLARVDNNTPTDDDLTEKQWSRSEVLKDPLFLSIHARHHCLTHGIYWIHVPPDTSGGRERLVTISLG